MGREGVEGAVRWEGEECSDLCVNKGHACRQRLAAGNQLMCVCLKNVQLVYYI